MRQKDDLKIKVAGLDYEETDKSIIIYNVPIAAEMVQWYPDGYALKSYDEIKKIKVDNVPLTIVKEEPTHPAFLTGSSTAYKDDVTVGRMAEPSKFPESKKDSRKRYADFILQKMDETNLLIEKFKRGEYIDTSIGFFYEHDETPGNLNGTRYDYVQREIILDHNAILMDSNGNVGVGRMPSPIGGIGADKMEKNDAFTAELNSLIQELQAKNPSLTRTDINNLIRDELWRQMEGDKMPEDKIVDELKKEIDSLKKENADLKTQIDKSKAADEHKDAIDEMKIEIANKDKELKEVKDELGKYKQAEKEALDQKRKELIEANQDMEDLYKEASDATIEKFHQKMVDSKSKEKPRDIGADMGGKSDGKKSHIDRINEFANKGKKKEGE